jgi:ACS family hexuronate transporter-like MFS transporter
MAGGFLGGWLSLRLMDRGMAAPAARFRVCLAAAVLSLATAAIPRAPTPAWATAGISLSIFAVAAFSVNTYTLPLDVFGGARAAFAVSMLVASYGAIQLVISPWFGAIIDRHGYAPVTAMAAFTPLAACAVLWGTRAAE